MRALLRVVGVVTLEILLAGCASAPRPYVFHAVPAPKTYAWRASLRVRTPTAVRALDGERILVRTGADLALLPDVSLGDRLPEVIAADVVETLRGAHIRASGERESANVDFDLQLEIRVFEFDAPNKTVAVTIAAKLVALANGRTIASKVFSARDALASSDPKAIVVALDEALHKTLTPLTTFVAAAIH